MNVREAIAQAEQVLPGEPAPDYEIDSRWQAIIRVGEFLETEPEAVWGFVLKWGKHPNPDLRAAVATCLLEHLLEHHFEAFFDRVEREARRSRRFADTFLRCARFGKSEQEVNRKRFDRLEQELQAS